MSMSTPEPASPARKRIHLDKASDDTTSQISTPVINPIYLRQDTLERLRAALISTPNDALDGVWQDAETKARCIATPFPVLQLPRFFSSSSDDTSHTFASKLQAELTHEPLQHRSNDLFDFYQSWDAQALKGCHIQGLRRVMSSQPVLGMIEMLLGVKDLIPGRVDMAAQRYDRGGYLLCHDDDIKEEVETGVARRVAFVYYLVDDAWSEEDGGEFAMFDTVNGQPNQIIHRILPERGALVMFRVGEISWHQVEEVRTRIAGRSRWSVTGWLYGPINTVSTQTIAKQTAMDVAYTIPVPAFAPLLNVEDPSLRLDNWICAEYQSEAAIHRVYEQFAEESTVQLHGFLSIEARNRLAQALITLRELNNEENTAWCTLGPASFRRYQALVGSRATTDEKVRKAIQVLDTFDQWLRSVTLSKYLERLTGLDLTTSIGAYGELRRIRHGDYTLLRDDWQEPTGLDVLFHLLVRPDLSGHASTSAYPWPDSDAGQATWQGAYHYVNTEDGEVLATLTPVDNALTLVYRDEGSARFLKYSLQDDELVERLDALYTFHIDMNDDDEDET
jgi:Rps23 Pro-64 3,4-dihydroxylase Tpa1-like proline 4-hydroxylase